MCETFSLSGENLKEGLYNQYLYKDGKKFIGQVVKSKESQYQNVPDFKRKTKEEYISLHNSKRKKRKKNKKNILKKTDIPTDVFLLNDEYSPLGKNIEINYEEITINKLVLNSVNTSKYMILKIVGGIYINKGIKFICEDINGDVINVSIDNVERYFNPKNFEFLEKEIFNIGKYLIVIEPNYGLFESTEIDEIKIDSPSEIILFKDKDELDYFLDKIKNASAENYKLLGNLMMQNTNYEKAIYYYEQAIKLNKDDENLDIVLHSNLSEAYLKYGYFSRTIHNADYCLDKINILTKDNKKRDNFLYQQKLKNLFRKIKALVTLRKFKEAYDILYNNSKDDPNKDIMKDFLKLEQVNDLTYRIKNGYENTLGKYDYILMLKDEEKGNFNFEKYGEYLNPKIEIKFEKGKGIKMIAKEKIHIGELLIAEKALAFSKSQDDEEKEDKIVSTDNPKVIVEIELYNRLYLKLKKSPLDYEKFYYLCDGRNLDQDLDERKKYAEEQDKGIRELESFKINQSICLNKYGSGRNILFNKDTGVGVWGFASFFNHDCLPNSSHFGIGDFYFGYCIRDIDQGEEITMKYVSWSKSYKERQQTLLENWRFNCQCQLCKYQLKKNDVEYNKYMEMMDKPSQEISKKDVKLLEEYLEKNKKKYSCYEMANAYLKLEEHYHIIREFSDVKRMSELVTKYADGKNYSVQLNNLNLLLLAVGHSQSNEFFTVYKELLKLLEKYTPLNSEEIQYLFRAFIKQ